MINVAPIRRAFDEWVSDGSRPRLLWNRREVAVSVQVGGREVDAFEASDGVVLRAALQPIFRHLPAHDGQVRLRAVAEVRGPLGLRFGRWDFGEIDLNSALRFLAG